MVSALSSTDRAETMYSQPKTSGSIASQKRLDLQPAKNVWGIASMTEKTGKSGWTESAAMTEKTGKSGWTESAAMN